MASRLLSEYKQKIAGLELVPSSGGCFELSIDGKLVYSKLETGQFPSEGDIVRTVGDALTKRKIA